MSPNRLAGYIARGYLGMAPDLPPTCGASAWRCRCVLSEGHESTLPHQCGACPGRWYGEWRGRADDFVPVVMHEHGEPMEDAA